MGVLQPTSLGLQVIMRDADEEGRTLCNLFQSVCCLQVLEFELNSQ